MEETSSTTKPKCGRGPRQAFEGVLGFPGGSRAWERRQNVDSVVGSTEVQDLSQQLEAADSGRAWPPEEGSSAGLRDHLGQPRLGGYHDTDGVFVPAQRPRLVRLS
eukprot:COSAG05_NODE_12380_length_470_cov_0.962264_1_plen_105_part_10